jgi:hypothetical protein
MEGPLYDFVAEANLPKFKLATLREQEAALNDEDLPPLAFDPNYLAYLKVAYGRALANCWFKLGERTLQVDRIFSYADKADLKGRPQPSWRGDDLRLDYSVPYFESMMPNWQENGVIVPFAGVGVNEMAAYDMLCFHFQFVPQPQVVLWEHEGNAYDLPRVQFVARDFAEFTSLVYAQGS